MLHHLRFQWPGDSLPPLGDEGSICMVGKTSMGELGQRAKHGLPFGLLSLVQTNVGWVFFC
jgi:hypothetical protein